MKSAEKLKKLKEELALLHPGVQILIVSPAIGWMTLPGETSRTVKKYIKLAKGNLVLSAEELWFQDIRIPLKEIKNASTNSYR